MADPSPVAGRSDSHQTALRVTAGPAVGRLIVVDDELRVGRTERGDGSLGGDAALSDAHAVLARDAAGVWTVRDLGSERGTLLNGRQLAELAPIHCGDTLRVGESRLLVVDGPARPVATHAVATAASPAPTAPWTPAPLLPPPAQPMVAPAAPRLADRIASYRVRWLAAFIDGLILGGIALGVVLTLGRSTFSVLLAIGLMLCWDFLFESLRGQTIGKRIVKIRVVRRDGSRLRPQHVAARNVLRLIDNAPGLPLIGLLSMILSGESRRQRLGDLAAGTIVVKSERMSSRLPESTRDRLTLGAYPVLWTVPVIAFALMVPSARWQSCKSDVLSASPPESSCLVRGPDGEETLLTGVNAGHTLHWQGTDIRLIATRARDLRGNDSATVVALEMSVRNASAQPVRFDVGAVHMVLNVPVGGSVRSARELAPGLRLFGYRALAQQDAIAPGATRVGWARFAVPPSVVPMLNTRLGSISFFPAVTGTGVMRVGNIRLWHPANAQGAEAAQVVFR